MWHLAFGQSQPQFLRRSYIHPVMAAKCIGLSLPGISDTFLWTLATKASATQGTVSKYLQVRPICGPNDGDDCGGHVWNWGGIVSLTDLLHRTATGSAPSRSPLYGWLSQEFFNCGCGRRSPYSYIIIIFNRGIRLALVLAPLLSGQSYKPLLTLHHHRGEDALFLKIGSLNSQCQPNQDSVTVVCRLVGWTRWTSQQSPRHQCSAAISINVVGDGPIYCKASSPLLLSAT